MVIIISILVGLFFIILATIVYILFKIFNKEKNKRIEIIHVNEQNQKKNEELEKEIKLKREDLQRLSQDTEILKQNLAKFDNELKQNAQKQAKQYFDIEKAKMDADLLSKTEQTKELEEKIKQQENKIQELEQKQLAYIQAKQREEEIAIQSDYYRLVIDDTTKNDIKALRQAQISFSKKEVIDKLIWDSYFKDAYDILVSHIFKNKKKYCGIYKITDLLTEKIYIGQSVDIKERWRQHIKSALAFSGATNKLYEAMKKDGLDNFTFELLEEVDKKQLNEREKYWIGFYKSYEYGLNSTGGNKST